MQLAAGTQLLQLASQQLPPHSVSQFCVSLLSLLAGCMSSCAQCDATAVAGTSVMAQVLCSGAVASATVSMRYRNMCSRFCIYLREYAVDEPARKSVSLEM
jgi:hypothetical protein